MGEQVRKSVILMQCDGIGMHRVLWKFRLWVGRGIKLLWSKACQETFHLNSILEDLRSCWGVWWVVRLEQKYGGKGENVIAVGSHGRVCGTSGKGMYM